MNSPEKDKAFFEAGLQELEAYILSKELYWPSPVQTVDFTQITLGALLLVRERLKGWKMPWMMDHTIQMDKIRLNWRSAWYAKAEREIRARVELWKNQLHEARHAPDEFIRQYPYQVRLRAILQLLLDDTLKPPPDSLVVLDAELYQLWQNGTFVWDPTIAWAFPQGKFWFLYGTPIAVEEKSNV